MQHSTGTKQTVRIPFHLDAKCYIKACNRAEKLGCSFDEFIKSIFLDEGVDAMKRGKRSSRH